MEITLFGDRSQNVAKTYKVIGTLLQITKQFNDAKDNLLKAVSIYEQKGMVKLVKDIK